MTSFRMSVTVLAVIHALFAGFTALVGAFANGGDIWQRLLVVVLHPLGAASVLVLVLRPRLATTTILLGGTRDPRSRSVHRRCARSAGIRLRTRDAMRERDSLA